MRRITLWMIFLMVLGTVSSVQAANLDNVLGRIIGMILSNQTPKDICAAEGKSAWSLTIENGDIAFVPQYGLFSSAFGEIVCLKKNYDNFKSSQFHLNALKVLKLDIADPQIPGKDAVANSLSSSKKGTMTDSTSPAKIPNEKILMVAQKVLNDEFNKFPPPAKKALCSHAAKFDPDFANALASSCGAYSNVDSQSDTKDNSDQKKEDKPKDSAELKKEQEAKDKSTQEITDQLKSKGVGR